MAAFDAGYIVLLLHPNPRTVDPRTKKPISRIKEKIGHLIDSLEKVREKIILPSPALSEALALGMEKASDYLAEITSSYGFEIAPFDTVAAVEAAIMTSDAKRTGGKKGGSDSTWAKVSLTVKSSPLPKSEASLRFIQTTRTYASSGKERT